MTSHLGVDMNSAMIRDHRIDAYIAKAAPFARPILDHVRERVRAVLPAAQETIKWSAPAFTLDGKILLIIAAFKNHAALNFWRGQELRSDEARTDAMGQFGKLTSVADLPPGQELDALILQAAEMSRSQPKPRQTKHAGPTVDPHPDFAAALDAAPQARAAFDAFAPSHRREYLEWINSAKRDETRAKRIRTAIEQLSEGKKQNWRYEKRG